MIFFTILLAAHLASAEPHPVNASTAQTASIGYSKKSEVAQETSQDILCVEVGWTRIKAGILPNDATYEKLKTVKTITAPSGPWLDANFPMLFKVMLANPLSPMLKVPHGKVSLSISGPVVDHRYHPDLGKRGIPVDLKTACEKFANCDVLVENDVICWAIGCQELLKLKSTPPKFPYLALTFGTSIGSALALDEETIYNIELTYLNCPFSRLKFLTREQKFDPKFTPHRALGKPYFDWKLGRREFKDEEFAPYLFNYNNRFQAFLEDFVRELEELFSIKIQNVLVGGGYSRFLDVPENNAYSVILMNPQALVADGISPDIIQLLGCWRLSQKNPPETILYPEYEDIKIIRSKRQKTALKRQEEVYN